MNVDKFVLNKLKGGVNSLEPEPIILAICFMIDKFGYEETLDLPIPVFLQMIEYYHYVAEKEKEQVKK